MIVIAGLVLGAAGGTLLAQRRGGKALDLLHYGAVYGIAFGVLGLLATVFIDRMV